MKVLLTILLFFFSYTCFAQAFGFVQVSSTAPPTPKDSIRVNVDTTIIQTGWSNLNGAPNLNIFSVTAGNSHTITVTSVSKTNWVSSSAVSNVDAYPNNGVASNTVWNYAQQTLQEAWYSYNNGSGGVNVDTFKLSLPKFIISGLIPTSTYTIQITGSQKFNFLDSTMYRVGTSAGVQSVGIFPVSGGQPFESFVTRSNTSQYAKFSPVTPDASGNIQIWVNAAAGQAIGVVSAFIIKEN